MLYKPWSGHLSGSNLSSLWTTAAASNTGGSPGMSPNELPTKRGQIPQQPSETLSSVPRQKQAVEDAVEKIVAVTAEWDVDGTSFVASKTMSFAEVRETIKTKLGYTEDENKSMIIIAKLNSGTMAVDDDKVWGKFFEKPDQEIYLNVKIRPKNPSGSREHK
ncbi:hypothetical protein SEVIR_2G025200v4 [Setaria viridis]